IFLQVLRRASCCNNMSAEQTEGEIMEAMPKENVDAVKNKKATYEIQDQISKGSRGCIFQVLRLEDKKPLAMKCEALKVKNALLKHEAKVYEALKSFYSPHFLSFEDRGVVEDRFTFIVLKLIGKNLADVQWKCPDRKFSLITALHIGEQTLAAIRDLHFCGYIHRDIKPHNFAIGREEDKNYHTVYIIDFKFARRFKTETKDLRLERAQAAFRGTPRYASITALSMKEQSRKDDLESWWYMMVELMIGRLPWADLADQKPYKLDDIKHVKKQIRLKNNLTKLLKATPEEYMTNIILYIDTLQYNSIPDYDYVAANLATSVKAYYLHKDAPPDWDLMAEYKGPRYEKTV
uniref:Protein kinase domain-containing protein n=1 Tax=Haemonchus contortus TaxID=6289 RepID=A0A7I4XU31_HAECO